MAPLMTHGADAGRDSRGVGAPIASGTTSNVLRRSTVVSMAATPAARASKVIWARRSCGGEAAALPTTPLMRSSASSPAPVWETA